MSWEKFIQDNIKKSLLQEGFSESLAAGGANQGVDLYRRMSQASRKGQMFDDCLKHARVWANRYGLAEDKPASVKKTKKPNQTKTLF